MNRKLTPLEINHLRRHGLSTANIPGDTPVEYLTHHADFYNLDFTVTQDTLIPRIESEKIIDLALDHLSQTKTHHPLIADIGTGSGCLALSLAHVNPHQNSDYFLSDISPKALKVAKLNAKRLVPSLLNRIHFIHSDLTSDFPPVIFDLVIANLPYIPTQNIPTLDPGVKNHEPLSALDGGPEGTTLIKNLLRQITPFINRHSLIILEIDDSHSPEQIIDPSVFTSRTVKDCFGVNRFLLIKYLLD